MIVIEERIHCWAEEEIIDCIECDIDEAKVLIQQYDLNDYEDLAEFFIRITEYLMYDNEVNEIEFEPYDEDETEDPQIQYHNDRTDVTVITRKESETDEEIYSIECRLEFLDYLKTFKET